MNETQAPAGRSLRTDPLQASPYRRQLEKGFRWLRFERTLEEPYLRESFENNAVPLRWSLLLAMALMAVVVLLDTFLVHAMVSDAIMVWRYGVLAPALLLAFLSSFLPDGWRWYGYIVTVLGAVILTAATVLVVNIDAQGNETIFGVLVLAIIFVYYLVGLPVYGALIANLAGLVAFVVSANVFGLAPTTTIYQLALLLFASVIGLMLAHKLEWLQRKTWLEQRMLGEMAERDGLTGIFNRGRLETHLGYAWEQGVRETRAIALMMVDVDSFKAYNDRYGHQAGDEALKQVANVLAGAARRPLDMVARYGGEEFVVELFDTTYQHATVMAERILEGVRVLGIPHAASAAADIITVSIGLAHVMPTAGRSVEGLLQIADQGVYIAKDGGGNRVEVMSQAEYAQMKTGWFDRKRPQDE